VTSFWQDFPSLSAAIVASTLHEKDLLVPHLYDFHWIALIETPLQDLSEPDPALEGSESRAFSPRQPLGTSQL
jgi:hypothetical protein